MKMLKIEITKKTFCGGEPAREGDVIEASEKDANYLVAIKKAKFAPDAKLVRVDPKKQAPAKKQ